ncbi:MAG TPA: DNA gyrase subunit A [Anaerolineaceae bacterium]|nr:DNA gyrase subunit A [Anaerolineaceae bacterium]
MELGLIRKIDIDSEMQQSYLDYAMSVIVARALPDARDGLKPVQRRILYAMYDMGLRPESAYKKSARIVGEVLGKYHPHGDMAVYDAMARLAQDFSLRYPLVDGQGNFGSVDGDPPAAMRYTEARLTAAAMEMINQIDKDTVDFSSNFDDTLQEPAVLPAAIPNLLVNGATGIAVGMATNIPPHNLVEVVDALAYMLDRWEKLDDVTIEELMRFVQGPDFPTGGVIIQDPQGDGLSGAYATGRGRVIVQARAHLEEMGRGRNRIIVTELPYMTNKSALIERIAELVREGRLEGVADLRDESDRQGMRIVIELSKTAEPETILRELYHRTPMQSTFGINLLALVEGEPHLLSLKQALKVYVEHRLVVIRRRSEFELARAKARAHILEGLRIALANLDEIIQLIRNSPDVEQARKRLVARFKLTEIQAQAILDMQLRRLAALERKKIEQEYKEVTDLIKELEALLRSPKKMRQALTEELRGVQKAYGDKRRTQIVRLKEGESVASLLTTVDVTPAESVWVGVDREGKISRFSVDELAQRTNGSAPHWLVQASTHHTLYLVGETGKAAAVAVHAVPATSEDGEGASIYRVSALPDGEPLAAIFALPPRAEIKEDEYVLTVTRAGIVKKTALGELPGPSAQTFILARVNEGDALGWALHTSGQDQIILATADGMSIRFSENEVRPMGLVAAGVGGIKLSAHDEVVGADVIPQQVEFHEIFLLTADGRAKRVALKEFPVQSRYGMGVIAWNLGKGALLAGMLAGRTNTRIFFYTRNGAFQKILLEEAPFATRAGQGKLIANLALADEVVGVTCGGEEMAPLKAASPDVKPKARNAAQPKGEGNGVNGSGPAKKAPARSASGKIAIPVKAVKEASNKAKAADLARSKAAGGKTVKKASASTAAVQPDLFAEELPVKPARKTTAKPAPARPKENEKTAGRSKGAAEKKSPQAKAGAKASQPPAEKTPTAKKPAAKKPAARIPAAKAPAPKTPAAKKPAAKKPAADAASQPAKTGKPANQK